MGDQRRPPEFDRAMLAAYPDLLNIARRLTGNQADARDLVQDTIVRGLSRRHRLREGSTVKHWLLAILRNLFIDRCRHSRVERQLARHAIWPTAVEPPEPPGPRLSEAFSPEDVRRALMSLSPSLRAPYALFTFDRVSYHEISRRLLLSAGTVASRVFRARQQLRGLLVSGDFRLRAVPADPVHERPTAPVSAAGAVASRKAERVFAVASAR